MHDNYSAVCLGIGNGSTHVLKGLPSSAFVILKNGNPYLLIDCGLGIVKSYADLFGLENFPNRIYISHNHTDHTGDLPVILALRLKDKKHTNIYGNKEVVQIIKNYRMHELLVNESTIDDFALWEEDAEGVIKIDENVSLILFESQHSYICYGFSFYVNDNRLLSYTGDSGYNDNLYEQISGSPIIIADGRDKGSFEHASLEQIDEYASTNKNSTIYVVHYEESQYVFRSKNVKLWTRGVKVELNKK